MNPLIHYELLKKFGCTPTQFGQIKALMEQLKGKPWNGSLESVRETGQEPGTEVLFAMEGPNVVGIGTLVVYRTLQGTMALIHDVCVSNDYHNLGIGTELSKRLVELSRVMGVIKIDLTSNPKR